MPQDNKMNRRKFLKTTASATVAAVAFPMIVPSSALGLGKAVAASERIVMGAIGTGGQGMDNMRNFLSKREVQMVAVCDVDRAHRDDAKKTVDSRYKNEDCKTYNDFREITRRDDIDAVLVATPDHWHVIPALDAARHGKDMYVQKPLALTIEEGRVLADVVKETGRVLQTGSQQRSDARFRQACELVRNGRIGKLTAINIGIPGNNKTCEPTWEPEPVPEGFDYDFWLGPARWQEYHHQRCHYQFRFILDYSGGQVTNFGAHNLDIAQWGLDMDNSGPVEISGNGEFPESGLFTTATKVFFECTYANGVRLTCKTGKFGMTFEGTEGTIYVDRSEIRSIPEDILKEEIGENEIHLYESRDHFRNFLECVQSRELPICNAEVGHRSSTVCNLGNIAMILGRTLKWNPKAERFENDDEANSMISRPMRGEWSLQA
jgi:predicted dehydrogenase